MLETIGKKLARAREAKGFDILDVEHKIRIPHNRLRELEDDDYSRFANLTYAKSFLKLYSNFLGVDTSEYRQELSLYEVDDFGFDPLANEFAEKNQYQKRPGLFAVLLVLLLGCLGAAYYLSEHYYGKDNPEGANSPVVDGGIGDEPDPAAKPPGSVSEEIPAAIPVDPENPDAPLPSTGLDPLPIVPAEVVEDRPLRAIPVTPDA